jgi:hypothetical protein
MERNDKEFYCAPSTTVVEVKFEGIVCASGNLDAMRNGYGNAEEISWF